MKLWLLKNLHLKTKQITDRRQEAFFPHVTIKSWRYEVDGRGIKSRENGYEFRPARRTTGFKRML